MPRLRHAASACLLVLLAVAAEARAMDLAMSLRPGSTLQLGAGPVEPLSGAIEVRCPTASCLGFGTVAWDVTELELQSASISLADAGPATFFTHPSAPVGFLVGRSLQLEDSGVLSLPPEKPASLFYGFEPVLTGTTGTVQHYRYWSLRTIGPAADWIGAFVPERLLLDLLLEEVFLDLDVLGITSSIGQTAMIHLLAVPVPEASPALLVLAGLAASARRPGSRCHRERCVYAVSSGSTRSSGRRRRSRTSSREL